ncbi:protein ELYS-like isoform X2 [Anneissia japonica]|uniref:protein ELYS-like isoform X2 n=1 Tax=Anneissia japonica TaxID=1529436 RepID=UPI0014257323|nr:protein ELYS-like isoform X2 [Anneissia japonica]
MRSLQTADWTSSLVPFNPASLQSLERQFGKGSQMGATIYGGTSDSGKWNWLVHGQVLEVVETMSGQRLASFCFDSDKKCVISCVKEYCRPGTSQLLVGLDKQNGGMLCLLDVTTSQILTSVMFPYRVTAVEPVTHTGGVNAPNFALSDHLRCFFGIIAVGTEGGHVYLVDLRLDDCDEYTHSTEPKNILVITPAMANTPELRRKSSRTGDHLCLEVGDNFHQNRQYNYSKPSGDVLKAFQSGNICVSALTYVPKLGSLLVGFDFGCFQVWRLAAPILEFSSPLTQVVSPITHFAYMEPDDDPENFSYLMVARGPMVTDISPEVVTDLHLFQLAYERKEFYPGHGYMYHEFYNCEARFEFALTADNLNAEDTTSIGSRLISCYTAQKKKTRGDDTFHEDEEDQIDLGLAVFCWEASLTAVEGSSTPLCFLALFDLNRWYHAQMPATVKFIQRTDVCPYLAFCSMESIMETSSPDVLLDAYVDTSFLSRFVSSQIPAPEHHFYPSSLSFSVSCLMETGLVEASFKGHQRQVLHDIMKQGPGCLRSPLALYNHSLAAGLIIPRNDYQVGAVPVAAQREALLSMCLEYNLISFLVTCISSWSTGDYVTGLTLRTVLDWAWQTVARIKEVIDEKCIFLYNGYGNYVEGLVMRMLDKYSIQLNHIITIFQALIEQSVQITQQGQADLETKLNVIMLISNHLQAVIWFIRVGLLPECPDDGQPNLDGQFLYPANRLREAFNQRRQELQSFTRSGGDSDILMIDGIIDELGDPISHLWDRKEESGGNGKYPPPSLHALLDIYLLENVPLMTKHCIVGYLLQDLQMCLDHEKHAELLKRIGQFEHTFCIPPGVARLLHGFFLLDHKIFEDAIMTFLDPLINVDLPSWQHQRIMKAFLYHNNSKKALHYQRMRSPPLNTLEDVQMHLTVLLANGLTAEAFQFQRKYNDPASAQDLLLHLFLGCQQTHTMDNLLQLHFNDEEEAMLVRYLETSTEPNSQELLVMHFLQRGRYVEAIQLNERLKQRNFMTGTDLKSKEHHATRNVIVESYSKLLPSVQRKLAFGSEPSHKRAPFIRREVQKPKPLSTVINPAKASQVISHASLISSVLDKIAEAREQIREQETPLTNRTEDVFSTKSHQPFVTTPITPHHKSRLSSGTAATIYPSNIEDLMDETLPGAATFSPQKSFGSSRLSMLSFAVHDNIKRMDYTGADMLSLLQTPPIKKRSPGHLNRQQPPQQQTPQSILKGQKKSKHLTTQVQDTGGTQADSVRATAIKMMPPPVFSLHDQQKAESAPTSQTTLLKHIRFSEDTKGRSPSPEDMDQSIPTDGVEDDPERCVTPEFLTPEKDNLGEVVEFSTPEGLPQNVVRIQNPEQVKEEVEMLEVKEELGVVEVKEEIIDSEVKEKIEEIEIDNEITFNLDSHQTKKVEDAPAEDMEQEAPDGFQETATASQEALPAVPALCHPVKTLAESPTATIDLAFSPILTSPLQFGNITPPSAQRSPLSQILVSKQLEQFDEQIQDLPTSPISSRITLTPPASAESSPMGAALSKSVSFALPSKLDQDEDKSSARSQTFAEISVQTTPGLTLRQESSAPKKTSFTASLKMSPPKEEAMEGVIPSSPVVTGPSSPVKQEPLPELDSPGTSSPSKLPTIKQEPIEKLENEDDSPKHCGTPSFIFSPPQTRSRAKRSARKTIAKVATPVPSPVVVLTPGLLSSVGTPVPTPQMRSLRKSTVKQHVAKKDAKTDEPVSRRTTRLRKQTGNLTQGAAQDTFILVSPLKNEVDVSNKSQPRKVVHHSHKMTLRTPKERKKQVKLW